MSLQGSIETFAIADVLRLLAATSKSGRLHVQGPARSGTIWVDSARVLAAESPSTPHVAGSIDVLFQMLRFERGSFRFEIDKYPPEPGEPIDIELALGEAETMLGEWRDLESRIPSPDAWVSLAATLPDRRVTVDQDEWKLVVAVAGGRSVAEVGDVCGSSELVTYRSVNRLLDLGLVSVGERPAHRAAPVTEPAPTARVDLVDTAAVPLLTAPADVAAADLESVEANGVYAPATTNGIVEAAAPPPPPPPPPATPAPPLVDIGMPASISITDDESINSAAGEAVSGPLAEAPISEDAAPEPVGFAAPPPVTTPTNLGFELTRPEAGLLSTFSQPAPEAASPASPALAFEAEPVVALDPATEPFVAEPVASQPVADASPFAATTDYSYPAPAPGPVGDAAGIVEYGYPPVPEPPAPPAPITWESAPPVAPPAAPPVWEAPKPAAFVPSADAYPSLAPDHSAPAAQPYPALAPPMPPVYDPPTTTQLPAPPPPPPPAPAGAEGAFGAPLVPPAPPVESSRGSDGGWVNTLTDAILEADAPTDGSGGGPFVPRVTPLAAPYATDFPSPALPAFGMPAVQAPFAPPPAPPAPPSAWASPTSLFEGGTPERLAPPPPPPPPAFVGDAVGTTLTATAPAPGSVDAEAAVSAAGDPADLESQMFFLSPKAREAVKQSSGLLGDGRGRR